MKNGFRQSMAWLHTWSGLVFAWLLFAIFFCGTLSFYREEITLWMQPELHRAARDFAQADAVDSALAALQRRAPGAKRWTLVLPNPRADVLTASWSSDGRFDRTATMSFDPRTGAQLQPRQTLGGTFFRSFHYSLLAGKAGIWIVGVATMVMLVGLVTGVVIHRKIFKDFFVFRPHKAAGRSWLDAHNVSAVMSLPFFLMITYTGLATLMFTWMPVGIDVLYRGNEKAFREEAFGRLEAPPPRGEPATLAPLRPLLEQAGARWHGAPLGRVVINNPGDAAATIDITRWRGATLAARVDPMLRFDGSSGRLLDESGDDSAIKTAYGVFYGLHVAWFADFALRALLFGMGLCGCCMIASGSVLWTVKRRDGHAAARAAAGYRVAEALNIAGIAGLMAASAAYFWANRLLPADLPDRFDAEPRCLFVVWLLMLAHAILRSDFPRAWREQLWFAALLTAALPLLNAATGGLALPQAIAQGHWRLAGIDLAALPIAALLCWAGWRIGRPRAASAAARAARPRRARVALEKAA